MGPATRTRTGGICLAALAAAVLTACSSGHHTAVGGVLVVDEEVTLERKAKTDDARREFPVEGNATFVAMVEEDGSDVKVRLTHEGAQDIDAGGIDVDTSLQGMGIELAVHDAPRGSRLVISLVSAQDFESPGKIRLKIYRYDAGTAAEPKVQARLAALRAWAKATDAQVSSVPQRRDAIRDIDRALVHFESSDGDPALAAWGRLVRSRINNRGLIDTPGALLDAQRAARGFDALGAARNAGRARIFEVTVLQDFMQDRNARNPTAEEAARAAQELLFSLASDHSMSASERARSVNFQGVIAYTLFDWAAARAKWREVIPMYEAIGDRFGRLQSLQNLGVLAAEQGDNRAAKQYFDLVLADIDRIGSISHRMTLLYNAAGVELYAGHNEQAIELLLRALELTRKHSSRQNEARILTGLGDAYSALGDTTQATTFHAEALKLRRTIDDPTGLIVSLRDNGAHAREAGDIKKALALHTEAYSLSANPDVRIFALHEIARDYAAASNYERAIATCRQALATGGIDPEYYRGHGVRLTLAESLLAQPDRTPEAVTEATRLTRTVVNAAISHEDAAYEIDGRRLLAQTHIARGALHEAREEYRHALALIFNYRGNIHDPGLQAATRDVEQNTFRGYVDLLMRDAAARGPNKLLPVSSAEEEALRVLEWARAINFDSARVSQLDAATQARVDELLTEMAGKRVRIAALRDRSDDVSRPLEILQLDIAQLRAQVDQLRAPAREANATATSTLVDAPWPAVDTGVTQLSYVLDTQHAYLWVRDSTGIRTTVLAASPAAVARDLTTLTAAIRSRTPQRIDATLARLSSVLIPSDVIAADSTTIQIVADGRIDGIPFAALSLPRSGGRLSDRQAVVMITSLFERRHLPDTDRGRALDLVALANDARSSAGSPQAAVFSTLQNTNAEVRAIAAMFQSRDPQSTIKLLSGAEGSAGNLQQYWKTGVEVIHFATHGLPDLRQPLTSLLLLPARDPAGNAAYLTAGQVLEWRGDVDLVFLGACDTAVGPVRFAEGMSGMQGAFLRAGARGVIATLWPVEDMYASQFAADFYRRYTRGKSAAESLSETQHAWFQPSPGVRDNEQAYRRMTASAHVFYAR